jgi:hypothetical protein
MLKHILTGFWAAVLSFDIQMTIATITQSGLCDLCTFLAQQCCNTVEPESTKKPKAKYILL